MKIVLAVDGSPHSLTARDLVAGIGLPADTTVHLVTAYQVPTDWTGGIGSTMDWVGDAEDAMRDEAHAELRRLAEPLAERGLAVTYHVERGRPAHVIIDLATELRAELVITGSRGHGALRSMLLGSVAGEVSAHAPCPHLVARRATVSRLLIATDGSDTAAQIPSRIAALGAFSDVPADVISVTVPDPAPMELMIGLYTLGDERLASMRRELEQHSSAAAAEMVEALRRVGIVATPHVRTGDPAAQIVEAAEELGADLIVIGSRGLAALERLVIGSVARNVLLHAGCSVLVIPDQGGRASA